jgi:organic radical activating enzyme
MYQVNECFSSLQGEGIRAGTANVFVRFTGCNLKCELKAGPQSPGGFDCDTEFASGRKVTLDQLHEWICKQVEITGGANPKYLILTGGEPGLQVDEEFCCFFHDLGYKLAIETNGTVDIAGTLGMKNRTGIDWVTMSPKVAEHAVKCFKVDELKYVRGFGQGIPKPVAKADHYLISPAADGNNIHPDTLAWCTKLVLDNPSWRLSCQLHKLWRIR